jgi:hypothetical protein
MNAESITFFYVKDRKKMIKKFLKKSANFTELIDSGIFDTIKSKNIIKSIF